MHSTRFVQFDYSLFFSPSESSSAALLHRPVRPQRGGALPRVGASRSGRGARDTQRGGLGL